MRRCALFVVAVLVGTAGCDDGDEGAASSTTEAPTTTEVEATTTSAPAPDPFSVPADPADIDEAYVEAVLAELERINGDALRLAVTEGLSPRITELIQSIYTPDRAAEELEVLVQEFDAGMPGVRHPPGDVVASVLDLLSVSADCVALDGNLDYSAVSESVSDPLPIRIELRRPGTGAPANETPWVFAVRTVIGETTSLPDPCAS